MSHSIENKLDELTNEVRLLRIQLTHPSQSAPNTSMEISPLIKDIASAFEMNTRSSNRIWITLAIITVLTLSPQFVMGPKPLMSNLPFSLGEIPTSYYMPFMLIILSLTAVHYCQTQAQAFLVYEKAHFEIKQMGANKNAAREHFDLLLFPTLSRIIPLVRLGRNSLKSSGAWNRKEKLYYYFVRVVTASILIGVPFVAIALTMWDLYNSIWPTNILTWLAFFGGTLALIALSQILFEEIRHSFDMQTNGAFEQ